MILLSFLASFGAFGVFRIFGLGEKTDEIMMYTETVIGCNKNVPLEELIHTQTVKKENEHPHPQYFIKKHTQRNTKISIRQEIMSF